MISPFLIIRQKFLSRFERRRILIISLAQNVACVSNDVAVRVLILGNTVIVVGWRYENVATDMIEVFLPLIGVGCVG